MKEIAELRTKLIRRIEAQEVLERDINLLKIKNDKLHKQKQEILKELREIKGSGIYKIYLLLKNYGKSKGPFKAK